jgi:hypothetical protein
MDERLHCAELVEESIASTAGEDYAEYHRERFEYVVGLCQSRVPPAVGRRILDIGRSPLSAMLRKVYDDLTTMGFSPGEDHGGHVSNDGLSGVPHICYNLTLAGDPSTWPEVGPFDLIVFAEVIEHLHIAPEFVLLMFRSMLAPGGILVVQTPNAAALHKRMKMFVGKNPYELIRPDGCNPGHFREYTAAELENMGNRAGLKTVYHEYREYFGCNGSTAKQLAWLGYRVVTGVAPSLRRGQTIIYTHP